MAAWRSYVGRRVILNTTNGHSVEGILWSVSKKLLVLREASVLRDGAEPVHVDGELIVERVRLEFAQALPEVLDRPDPGMIEALASQRE